MKYFIILVGIIITSGCSYELQPQSAVPMAVRQRLITEYQGVKSLRWSYDGEYYTADFRRASYQYRFIFDQNANLLRRREEIAQRDFPSTLKQQVQQCYPTYRLRRTSIVLKTTQLDTIYIAEIQRGMKFYELYMSAKGHFVEKKIVLPEDRKQLLVIGAYW